MGNSLRRSLATLSILLFAQTVFAAQKKYIVTLNPSAYSSMKIANQQRSGGFLGLRAQSAKYLDHLQMAVVEMDESQLSQLQNRSEIVAVEEDRMIPQPVFRLFMKSAYVADRKVLKNAEPTWGMKAIAADKAWNITRGTGVRVLVLDTGVDSAHPDLVGRLEKGENFVGGTDFFDDVGHGTHTSGTVLADGAGSGLLGVAPDAHLLMAKVCVPAGCSTTGIVQGIEWGIKEKVDVMNLSLGGPFLSSAAQKAYAAAEKAGVVVVAAAGNDGTATISYPAAIDTVLAVGALNPDLTKAPFSQWGPELDVMAPGVNVFSSVPQGTGREGLVSVDLGSGVEELTNTVFQNSQATLNTITGEIIFVGLGKVDDFTGKDLTGKIALIQRGEIAFAEKVDNAIKAKAKGVLIFNNEPGLITGGLQTPVNIPVLMIEQAPGQALAAKTVSTKVEMGVVASDYAAMAGTSMASPHVAGVAALVRSANASLSPAQVRDVIKNTCHALSPNTDNQFGRGVVDAEAAVKSAMSAKLL